MTLPEQACRVYALSVGLTAGELFVLVKTWPMDKGTSTRGFRIGRLSRPAVRRPLEQHGYHLDNIIDGLIAKGMLEPPRGNGVTRRTSPEGDMVAHAFVEIKRELTWLEGIPYGEAHSIERLPEVRERLLRMCEESRE